MILGLGEFANNGAVRRQEVFPVPLMGPAPLVEDHEGRKVHERVGEAYARQYPQPARRAVEDAILASRRFCAGTRRVTQGRDKRREDGEVNQHDAGPLRHRVDTQESGHMNDEADRQHAPRQPAPGNNQPQLLLQDKRDRNYEKRA